jgi:hypothetical protein
VLVFHKPFSCSGAMGTAQFVPARLPDLYREMNFKNRSLIEIGKSPVTAWWKKARASPRLPITQQSQDD